VPKGRGAGGEEIQRGAVGTPLENPLRIATNGVRERQKHGGVGNREIT